MPSEQGQVTVTPIIFRETLKVILDTEVINGRRICEIYVAFRGRGFYVGWGGVR